ncbi:MULTISPECIES: DUF998 domain-containing protein [unclassified Shewanella]|uniref:DUF998 domain-containing protein n=1 Tax=unclassified Shewanella TaxID=196818 RepID=UPI001BC56F56|nr:MULTISPECIES: DUF998 domain-containing protein [unclassified Shewanella]MCG9728277.1 DUF998 domain-containing protein [Shewanella sp. Isolate13]GIU16294.1 hypothetical protein TUM3792_09850 [Shewanella sp. MBTL60-007]
MDDNIQRQSMQYDLHRLVVLSIFIGALIAAAGVFSSVWFEYQHSGLKVLNTRPDQLGDYTYTPLAFVYNISLMVAGLCIMLSMLGLYLLKLGNFSHYLSVTGAWVGLAVILMGMFPINYIELHRFVSTCYLIGTVVMFFLCISDKFNHHSICSWPVFFFSILGFIAASVLIFQLNWRILDFPPCENHSYKQPYCWVAITMWLLTNIIMLWCLSFAWNIRNIAIKSYLALSQSYLAGD